MLLLLPFPFKVVPIWFCTTVLNRWILINMRVITGKVLRIIGSSSLVLTLMVISFPVQAQPINSQAVQKHLNPDLITSVVTTALTFIAPRALELHTIRTYTLWGMNGLSTIDPSIMIAEENNSINLKISQSVVLSLPEPNADDVIGWSRVFVQFVEAAWSSSSIIQKTNQQDILQSFFDELFNHLDPYSRYISPTDAVIDRNKRTGGNADIGVTLTRDAQGMFISSVNTNGPAWDIGIDSGTKLYTVDDQPVERQSPATVQRWLSGQSGSHVKLTIGDQNQQRITLSLERRPVPPETVFAFTNRNIVILRITSFSSNTAQELSQYLDLTGNKKLKGIVLDLRGNKGGVLQQAVMSAALIMDHGIAAKTQGRDPQANHIWAVKGGDLTNGLPLITLVDGHTASAAEILAAALADHRRSVIVGSSTFGKGLVQIITQLPDMGELFVTWSQIIAPLDWPLQSLGVIPQICTSTGLKALREEIVNLKSGQNSMGMAVREARKARYPFPVQRILEIRKMCPAAIGTDSDLDIAKYLIENPAVYRTALDIIPPLKIMSE